MVKRAIVIGLSLLFVFAGASYSGTEEAAQVYEKAKKEGEVSWASTLREQEARPLVKAFQKDFPGIKVTYTRQHGGEAMERLVREVISGRINYDVSQIHEDYMQEFMKMDAVERINWADFNVVPQFIHFDNRFVGVFDYPYVFVFNYNLLKREEAPKTWNDFLDPKWKGKFCVDSRPLALFALAGAWGPEKTLDYIRKLAKNEPIFVRGSTKNANLMAAGDYMINATCYLSSGIFIKSKGGPLDWNFPDTIPTSWADFSVLKGAKNPNAGKLFLGWLGSKGYKRMDDINWGRSAPFGGTRKEQYYKGKTLSYPPTKEQVPDRNKFLTDILIALGLRK